MLSIPYRAVLNMPLQSDWALPTAAALGAAVGGGMAAALQGMSNMLPGATFGSMLGVGWASVLQGMDEQEARLRAHHAQVRAFADYPAVQALLRRAGTSVDDELALQRLSGKLEADFARMTERFNEYCVLRDLAPNRLIGEVIRHFYLTHCADRGIVLLSKRNAHACYLVATNTRHQGDIAQAMNQEGVGAGTALRQMRCPYLRVDLANERLSDARAFTTEVRDGEWQVLPAELPPGQTTQTFAPGPLVHAVRRRCPRASCARAGRPASLPEAAVPSSGDALVIQRGPLLRAKLAALPSECRTWRELERIEQDLAAHRPCGHLITYQGEEYLASDLHMGGRRCPGRNAWRLLHRRIPGGHELVDIVDPHGPRR
ncbi:hypothetical protein [Stenotrophomonas oahuensis]|uniref:Uncharacterized protein n=1 Tax=Stenotrophomonas oahuensis TaxID=3003271 RepID=A0ABY9YUU8_9GAMM|nr:hypothetical protein [Stenotrophomonas sp. A5586]WNH53969.1 hypothetical protein PDM29_06715 [Stenotrophomonas sp. A5586]